MAQRENLANQRSEYERGNIEEQGRGQAVGTGAGLQSRTTGESDPYCANPATTNLPKEFETRVNVIEKVPEFKTVTKTDHVKKLEEREEIRTVPRTRVVEEEREVTHTVPHVREVPRTREEIRHRVIEEKVQVPYTERIVEQVPVTKTETVPRVVREDVQKRVRVPHVTEVPVQRQVEVPTGRYCEQEVDQYTQKGATPHLGTGLVVGTIGTTGLQQTGVPSSSSEALTREAGVANTSGTGSGHSSGAHNIGTGVGTGPRTGTNIARRYDTELENPAKDYGLGTNDTGLGHGGLDYGLGIRNKTDTDTGVPGAEPLEARVARLSGTGAGVSPRTAGAVHTGPSAIATGRPVVGGTSATGVAEPHHEKKGLLKKIEEKLHRHH